MKQLDGLALYKTVRDIADEANAVDTIIGRPEALQAKIRALRDDLGASISVVFGAWQPIETAPKDGAEVLLYAPGRVTYGAWSKPSETPHITYRDGFAPEPEYEDFDPYWASWDGGFTEAHPPTHWMPLPEPPK